MLVGRLTVPKRSADGAASRATALGREIPFDDDGAASRATESGREMPLDDGAERVNDGVASWTSGREKDADGRLMLPDDEDEDGRLMLPEDDREDELDDEELPEPPRAATSPQHSPIARTAPISALDQPIWASPAESPTI